MPRQLLCLCTKAKMCEKLKALIDHTGATHWWCALLHWQIQFNQLLEPIECFREEIEPKHSLILFVIILALMHSRNNAIQPVLGCSGLKIVCENVTKKFAKIFGLKIL